MESKMQVGDKVTIIRRTMVNHGPYKILSVKRVMKLFIELEDGSKWTHDGGPYPRKDYTGYSQPKIELTTQYHKDYIRFHNLKHKLEKWLDKAEVKNVGILDEIWKLIVDVEKNNDTPTL